ncbi:hypothetical protein EON67_08725 [archaeon]|nr:MAG: hypothetical protein EON67_08725 [archaeon]
MTGNTIFNVLRLGEFEVDKDDRPLEPPFIKSVEVLVNPFEDIMPRYGLRRTRTRGAPRCHCCPHAADPLLHECRSIKRAGSSAVAEAAAAKAKAEADAARRARLAAAPAKILSFGEDEEDGAGAQSIRQPVSRARG